MVQHNAVLHISPIQFAKRSPRHSFNQENIIENRALFCVNNDAEAAESGVGIAAALGRTPSHTMLAAARCQQQRHNDDSPTKWSFVLAVFAFHATQYFIFCCCCLLH